MALTAVLLVFLVSQCALGLLHGRALSARAVHRFHAQLNAGRYAEIWDQADAGFRSTGKEQDMVDLLAAVHRKLGNAGAESPGNIRIQTSLYGTFLTAVYGTQFDRDSATETFSWKKAGDELSLVGYNIQSNALVIH